MRAQSFQRPGLRLLGTFALLALGVIGAAPQETPPAEFPMTVTPEAHLSQGYDALKLDRYDVAVREFQAALTADPGAESTGAISSGSGAFRTASIR